MGFGGFRVFSLDRGLGAWAFKGLRVWAFEGLRVWAFTGLIVIGLGCLE